MPHQDHIFIPELRVRPGQQANDFRAGEILPRHRVAQPKSPRNRKTANGARRLRGPKDLLEILSCRREQLPGDIS